MKSMPFPVDLSLVSQQRIAVKPQVSYNEDYLRHVMKEIRKLDEGIANDIIGDETFTKDSIIKLYRQTGGDAEMMCEIYSNQPLFYKIMHLINGSYSAYEKKRELVKLWARLDAEEKERSDEV